jgi:hypothetical protein
MLSATTLERTTDRSHMHQYLQQCADARGRLHHLRCTAEAFNALFAPRFLTTLMAITIPLLAGLALLS